MVGAAVEVVWWRQLDQKYLQDRALAEEIEKQNGMESKCQVMALDVQAMTKSLEHMAVRFHTFSVVQKQLQILQDDFNQTQTKETWDTHSCRERGCEALSSHKNTRNPTEVMKNNAFENEPRYVGDLLKH